MNIASLPRARSSADGARPQSEDDRLCVVVVTYNSGGVIAGLLDSLPDGLEGVAGYEVIVVDNDSQDGSAEIAANHPLRPRVIRSGANAGYAAGINIAATAARDDAHLLILNPDLRLLRGSVRPMLDALGRPGAGIALPRNFKEDGDLDPTIRREPSVLSAWSEALLGGTLAARLGVGEVVAPGKRYERAGPVEWATASALLVAARARHAVGPWDESFFLYSEEVDYQRRVRRAGMDIVYVPESEVMHIGGEYRVNSRLYALLTSNRIRYFGRHHGTLATLCFRAGIAAGEALRGWRGSVHRTALACAVRPLAPALSFRTDS